jgi:sulfate permease, SulP family
MHQFAFARSAPQTFRREFQLRHLLPSFFAGSVIALMTVTIAVSFAALIFVRPIDGWMSYGSELMVFTAIVAGLGMFFFSSYPGTIAIPEDRVAPILALMAGLIIQTMGSTASSQAVAMTVLAAIALSSLLAGLTCYLLGRFRLGNIVRFFPHPVIGGFLAGSGWLLVVGSIRVMYEKYSSLDNMTDFFSWDVALNWLPGAIFGVVLYVATRRAKHYLTLPVLIVVALVCFFIWLHFGGISIADARERGWLLEVETHEAFHPLNMVSWLGQANWGAIIAQAGSFGAILLTVVISILLNTTALELAVDRDIDLNQELRAAGLTNLAGGLGGGMASCQSLSLSKLAAEIAAPTRMVGLFFAIICALLLWFGSGLLGCIPRFVLGGILLFHGIEFLVEWVWDAYEELALEDYLLVQLILIIVTLLGYLAGVGAGILIATVFFVVKYSSIKIVKAALSGIECHSTVDRWPPQKRLLEAHGKEIYLLRLQGYIFFGSANGLLHRILQRSLDQKLPRLHYVILDFQHVSGMDASALISMRKLARLASREGFVIVMTSIAKDIAHHFHHAGLLFDKVPHLRLFPDCDHGLEWCEDRLLERESAHLQKLPDSLRQILLDTYSWSVDIGPLFNYMERVELEKGQHLITQGSLDAVLYFIESGRVQVQMELDNGRLMRVRSMEGGTVVGEIGLYMRRKRTASVVVEQKGVAYRLTASKLKKLEAEHPPLGLAFHQYIIWTLADRLSVQNLTVQALFD